jgi:hypothetical protein
MQGFNNSMQDSAHTRQCISTSRLYVSAQAAATVATAYGVRAQQLDAVVLGQVVLCQHRNATARLVLINRPACYCMLRRLDMSFDELTGLYCCCNPGSMNSHFRNVLQAAAPQSRRCCTGGTHFVGPEPMLVMLHGRQ